MVNVIQMNQAVLKTHFNSFKLYISEFGSVHYSVYKFLYVLICLLLIRDLQHKLKVHYGSDLGLLYVPSPVFKYRHDVTIPEQIMGSRHFPANQYLGSELK